MQLKSILDDEIFDISCIVDFTKIIQIIDITKGIFDILAENTSTMIKGVYDKTEDKIYYLKPIFFESTSNILKSILICTRIGNIIDSHILVRKLRDDLFQWLFLLSTIENNDNYFIEAIEKNDINIYESKKEKVSNIVLWFKNIIHQNKYIELRKKEYDYIKYKTSLQTLNEVDQLYKHYLSESFTNLNDLNNYVHGNGEKYVFENQFNSKRVDVFNDHLSSLESKLEDVILCYLCTLFLISPNLLISNDYFSLIESRQKPDDRLRTIIAPIFQDFFDKYVKLDYENLIIFLNSTNKHGMVIE